MQMIRIQDAAGILGVTTTTLYNHIRELKVRRHKSVTMVGVESLMVAIRKNSWCDIDTLPTIKRLLLNRSIPAADGWAFISDAAKQFKVSTSYIYMLIYAGDIETRGRRPKQVKLSDVRRMTSDIMGICKQCGGRFRYSTGNKARKRHYCHKCRQGGKK